MKDQKAAIGRSLMMMRRDIDHIIKPEATSPFAQYTAMTLALMLEQLAVFHHDEGDEEGDGARAGLIAAIGGDEPAASGLQRDFEDRSGNGDALSQAIATHLAGAEDKAKSALISRIAASELALLRRERERVAADVAADEALMAVLEFPVTIEALDRYFAQSPVFAGARATSVWQIPGGYSKDTYMVSIVDAGGVARDIVLRRDFPFGPTETSAADEFDILRQLAELGLAVARPITSERSAILGQPFLIVERVAGHTAADDFDRDPALARSISLQMAEVIGKLHALDPADLGLVDRNISGPREQVGRYLAQWKSFWMRNRRTGSPIAEAAFIWLEANAPSEIPRLVPVHGDARQHNVMSENGRLTAMLDWEFIHAGDPAEDLEYMRLYVEPYIEWGAFIAAYLAAGGVKTSESGSRYYEVFRALRNFICCDVSWSGFVTGKYPVNKLAVQGIVYRRDFLRNVGEALLRVTAA